MAASPLSRPLTASDRSARARSTPMGIESGEAT